MAKLRRPQDIILTAPREHADFLRALVDAINGAPPLSATTPANGAVLVTFNNAPAGSPAAPARYVKIPDGAGGFWTFGSLT